MTLEVLPCVLTTMEAWEAYQETVKAKLVRDLQTSLFQGDYKQVYIFASEEPEPLPCPFAFMDAQRQPEPKPPSTQTLALWRAISFHGG